MDLLVTKIIRIEKFRFLGLIYLTLCVILTIFVFNCIFSNMAVYPISDRVNLAIDEDFKKILSELKSQFPLLKEPDLIKMAVSSFYTNQNSSDNAAGTVQSKLLFEIRRLEIVKTKFFKETEDLYPDAYVFAVVNKIEPLYHLNYDNHLYSKYYEIPIVCIAEVQRYLDGHFNETKNDNKIYLSYFDLYEITKKYNPNYNGLLESEQMRVFDILRYMFLSDRFANYFKKTVTDADENIGMPDFREEFKKEPDLTLLN